MFDMITFIVIVNIAGGYMSNSSTVFSTSLNDENGLRFIT
ncbi:hypothetical protein JCM19237_5015 [Photobacterium aphoticum]|uniref:Uncharacterized protein n=1 Tax=Photobacterium aphoticum TaxID=754436 RepID=A0A090R399_9GAMM|nr:hypothetical protein JCM19237_5015 [Photobacterium aphoticum]